MIKFVIKKGNSLVEVLLSVSIFALIVAGTVGVFFYGQQSAITSGNLARANFLAQEGIEAMRNLRDVQFSNLADGTYGLSTVGNQWSLVATPDVVNGFTRTIAISSIDTNTKRVTVTINWPQTAQRTGTQILTTDLTNWQSPVVIPRGGLLVYGGGGVTSDVIRYRTVNTSGTWSSEQTAGDVDSASTNRYLRAVRVFASATRNEKVMVSRHYNGTTQYIYAQVWNGSSWGNIQLLSNWNATTFLDVQNFDGTYLNNGDFVVVYSDNTNTPKFRTWNGSSWSGAVSLPNIGGIPAFVVAKQRPASNEVMAAFFDQSSDTNTTYFNGGSYITANWTLHTEHAATAPSNTRKHIDFVWSKNNQSLGALIYANGNNDKSIEAKFWTANGSGSGAWSAATSSPAQASNQGALDITSRPGVDEFVACDKDMTATPRVYCYRIANNQTWSASVNNTIASATTTGIQRSFDVVFEELGTGLAINIYSDATTSAKLKTYSAANNTWDANPISVGTLNGTLESSRTIPQPDGVDLVVLLGDTNQGLYSVFWDGVNHQLYTTPSGKSLNNQGSSGSNDADFWYDFAWDRF